MSDTSESQSVLAQASQTRQMLVAPPEGWVGGENSVSVMIGLIVTILELRRLA